MLLEGQPDPLGGDVLIEVRDRGRSGDGQHVLRALQQPGEHDLTGQCTELPTHFLHDPAGPGVLAEGEGEERDERDPGVGGMVDHGVVAAGREVVEILHRRDRRDLTRLFQFGNGDLGQADVPHLALIPQLGERTHLVGDRIRGIDPMQVEQIDGLDSEPPRAQLGLLLQVAGVTERHPLRRRGPEVADFRGEDQVLGVGVQCFRDQFFTLTERVGIGGVDELHSEFDRAAERRDRVGRVSGRPPDVRAVLGAVAGCVGEPHGAQADATYREVATQEEGFTGGGGCDRCHVPTVGTDTSVTCNRESR